MEKRRFRVARFVCFKLFVENPRVAPQSMSISISMPSHSSCFGLLSSLLGVRTAVARGGDDGVAVRYSETADANDDCRSCGRYVRARPLAAVGVAVWAREYSEPPGLAVR